MAAYMRFAQLHYRRADGTQTSEVKELSLSFRPVRRLYAETRAVDFGPLALESVRREMLASKLCRPLINKRIDRVRRMFRWATSQQLVPVAVYQALKTLSGLQRGRTEAREPAPIKPVGPDEVIRTLPFLGRHLRAMVELQRLTGMRPGEVCEINLAEVDRTTDPWTYRPGQHKTLHHGKQRVVMIGPRGQRILEEFMVGSFVVNASGPLFSPRQAREERFAAMRAKRKSKVTPSQENRRSAKPEVTPAEKYTPHSYAHAIRVAAQKANPLPSALARRKGEKEKDWKKRLTPAEHAAVRIWRRAHHWHPNQLRHLYASEVRKTHGLEAVQVLLGHAKANITEMYAERDLTLAAFVASKVG